MGIGKILGYTVLGVVGGVAAVAAAPFTGGGSLLGAATLAASLTGAGTIAAAAGTAAVAGGAGALLARNENEKDEKISNQNEEIAELNVKADKFEEGFNRAIKQFKGDKEYFNYIIGMTALGVSMANEDGKISKEEIDEMQNFIGGVVNSNYPSHIKDSIMEIVTTKPNFNTAMLFLEKINPSNYQNVRDLIELVAFADGIKCEREEAFLKAFDSQILLIQYKPEVCDYKKEFLLNK